jgi:hypothetical protein
MWHVCGRQTASRQGCHGIGRAPEALDDGHAALDAAVHGQHAAAQGGVRGAGQAEDLRIAGRAVERPEVVEGFLTTRSACLTGAAGPSSIRACGLGIITRSSQLPGARRRCPIPATPAADDKDSAEARQSQRRTEHSHETGRRYIHQTIKNVDRTTATTGRAVHP